MKENKNEGMRKAERKGGKKEEGYGEKRKKKVGQIQDGCEVCSQWSSLALPKASELTEQRHEAERL